MTETQYIGQFDTSSPRQQLQKCRAHAAQRAATGSPARTDSLIRNEPKKRLTRVSQTCHADTETGRVGLAPFRRPPGCDFPGLPRCDGGSCPVTPARRAALRAPPPPLCPEATSPTSGPRGDYPSAHSSGTRLSRLPAAKLSVAGP